MNPFHYPPASLEARFPFDGLGLFATATNVGGEAELLYGSTHFIKVITFIQAQTLRLLPGERRSFHRNAVHRGPNQLHIVAISPSHRQPPPEYPWLPSTHCV